jgi:hypothetical protein
MNNKVDYTPWLKPGETLELTPISRLRKRAFDARQRMTEADREALAEARYEQAQEHKEHEERGLLYFSELTRNHPAETLKDEVMCHRRFLRAFQDQPDVQQGESLRQLARRTWIRWLRGQAEIGGDAWAAAFNPKTREFEFHGFTIRNGAEPGFFDRDWRAPADCQNGEEDQPIDCSVLADWPDFGRINIPAKAKLAVAPPPAPAPVFEFPDFRPSIWGGYSTRDHLPNDARNYLDGAR